MTDTVDLSEPAELVRATEASPAHAVVATTMASIGMPTPAEWAALSGMAQQLSRSKLVPVNLRGQPDDIMLILLTGRDLQVSPTQALNKIHVIEGKPSVSPELMVALVRRAGYPIWPGQDNDRTKATAFTQREGREYHFTFTVDDAVAAGLCRVEDGKVIARSEKGKPLPWETWTQFLVWARAVSGLCRMVYPDVLMGVAYVPEELGAQVDEHGEPLPVTSGDYRPVGVPDPNDLARQDGWDSVADYEDHFGRLKDLVGSLGERLAQRFWVWCGEEGIPLPGPKTGWEKAWAKAEAKLAEVKASEPTKANEPPPRADPARLEAAKEALARATLVAHGITDAVMARAPHDLIEAERHLWARELATEHGPALHRWFVEVHGPDAPVPSGAPPEGGAAEPLPGPAPTPEAAQEVALRDVTPEEQAVVAGLPADDPMVEQVVRDVKSARTTFVDQQLADRGLLHGPQGGTVEERRRRLSIILINEGVAEGWGPPDPAEAAGDGTLGLDDQTPVDDEEAPF